MLTGDTHRESTVVIFQVTRTGENHEGREKRQIQNMPRKGSQ